jgi:hypothetical protein
MTDFANFDRQESYFRPYKSHLDVFARLRRVNLKEMAHGEWSYKLKIFCTVPLILFQCECTGCNILMHLNMPLLQKLTATSWLEAEHLTFMLLVSDASRSNEIICGKTMRLTKLDSDVIRGACSQQRTLTSMQVEDLVGILYQLEIKQIWPHNA